MSVKQGSFTCVGPGIVLGAHMTIRCQNYIEQADVVFMSCHPIMEQLIQTLNKDARSLQAYYAVGKDRRITYQQMTDAIMREVRRGKRVVGVFYGHPGVFATVPHRCVKLANQEGYTGKMEPGISAEDCLYADMGIDPGEYGCQHFEASQLMFYQRKLDPTAYLILWQIGLAGDLSIAKRLSSVEQRQVLVDVLSADYPLDHSVAIYECATLIVDAPRVEWLPLKALPNAALTQISTLVIPPCEKLVVNSAVLARLRELN